MPRFRKKPVVIEAFQMTEEAREDNRDWPNWLNQAWTEGRFTPNSLYPRIRPRNDGVPPDQQVDRRLSIMTLEGEHLVSWGDFIIQGIQGELYPCKPDIFEATYEPVGEEPGINIDPGPHYGLKPSCRDHQLIGENC